MFSNQLTTELPVRYVLSVGTGTVRTTVNSDKDQQYRTSDQEGFVIVSFGNENGAVALAIAPCSCRRVARIWKRGGAILKD